MRDFTLTVGQWPVEPDRGANLDRAEEFLRWSSDREADLCLLPEMFQTPYELDVMKERAEPLDGPSARHIAALAADLGVWVVAGSIPERLDGCLANTSIVFGSDGKPRGIHRKIHLFDVSLPNVRVKESSIFEPGQLPLVVDTPFCRLGVVICYDVRFPAVFGFLEDQGVEVVAVPAAFSRTTGRAHWDVVMRSRAIDYQVFLAAACPAPNVASEYVAYGHSLIADPWGTLLAQAGEGAESIVARCEAEKIERVRRELPLLAHRRRDLYRGWDEQAALKTRR